MAQQLTVLEAIRQCPPFGPLHILEEKTATGTTDPAYPCTDLSEFRCWREFPNLVTETENRARSHLMNPLPETATFVQDTPINDEVGVYIALSASMHRVLPLLARAFGLEQGIFTTIGGNKEVVGDPDFIYRPAHRSSKAKVVIEVKTSWAFPMRQPIIEAYGKAKTMRSSKVTKAVQQIYGYMTFNHLRFGVLTTYEKTWFLRRTHEDTGGVLEVSDVFPRTDTPSLLAGYLTLLREADTNWLHVSPTSSPHPSPGLPRKYASLSEAQDVPVNKIRFIHGVDRSRAGSIVQGKYANEDVIFKVVDASKHADLAKELEREAEAYQELQKLKDKHILLEPRAYIRVWDMLEMLVLPRYEQNVKQYLDSGGDLVIASKRCRDCLQALHDAGYIHGDVKRGNFVTKKGTLFGDQHFRIIDLAQTRKGSQYERKMEMEEFNRIFVGNRGGGDQSAA